MARLFGDENFSRPVMAVLRTLGHDVDGVQERGLGGIRFPDHLVLAEAVADGRAVLTTNRGDFRRLHRLSAAHAGIVTCTQDSDVSSLADRIHATVTAAGDLTGQILSVTRPHRATP
jgi:hypothetical protein